jgi:hypothetical protein
VPALLGVAAAGVIVLVVVLALRDDEARSPGNTPSTSVSIEVPSTSGRPLPTEVPTRTR